MAKEKDIKKRIEESLDKVRPSLEADGGGVELVSFDEDKKQLRLKMLGMCSGCPMSQITLEQTIATQIKEDVPEVEDIVSV